MSVTAAEYVNDRPAVALVNGLLIDTTPPGNLTHGGGGVTTYQATAHATYFDLGDETTRPAEPTQVWSSSNPAVFTVDSVTGLVTEAGAGTATLTVRAGGAQASQSVTVVSGAVAVASVTLSASSVDVTVNGTQQVTATARDAGGNPLSGKTFTWASSSPSHATASSPGNPTTVTGVATGGSPTLTATCDGIDSTPININVSAAPAGVIYAQMSAIDSGATLAAAIAPYLYEATAPHFSASIDAAPPGSPPTARAFKCSFDGATGNHEGAYLRVRFKLLPGLLLGNPMRSLADGIYLRFYFYIATVDLQAFQGTGEQVKFFFARDNAAIGASWGTTIWGLGSGAGANQPVTHYGTLGQVPSGLHAYDNDGAWTLGSHRYFGGYWARMQLQYRSDGTTTYNRGWFNTEDVTKVAYSTSWTGTPNPNSGMGSHSLSSDYGFTVGIRYLQNTTGSYPFNVWLSKMTVANRFILDSE